ncbi:MAG: hypothetical protein KA151_11375 [Piscinibacter sp.]|nr:hypothetical protein [Piscinibacter sp.]
MLDALDTYFAAEQAESLLFLAFGLCAWLAAGLIVWRWRDPLLIGLALPLVFVGLIQIGVGASVYVRTAGQVAALKDQYRSAPATFKAEELGRMQVVRSSFVTYKAIEIAFIGIGLALAVPRGMRRFWRGLGLGMMLQGALMLPADLAAEARADTYIRHLQALP